MPYGGTQHAALFPGIGAVAVQVASRLPGPASGQRVEGKARDHGDRQFDEQQPNHQGRAGGVSQQNGQRLI